LKDIALKNFALKNFALKNFALKNLAKKTCSSSHPFTTDLIRKLGGLASVP